MAFTIVNSAGSTVLTGATPFALTNGTYYVKRLKVDSPVRKVSVDSSPSAVGSFAQDFDNHSWPISGGTLIICDATEAAVKAVFEAYAALIKNQIELTLTIPNESGTYPHCMNTSFELMRVPDGRIVKPNDTTNFRAYVMMDFLQLSK